VRGKAVKVRTQDGETAHRALARVGALDPTRKPRVEDGWLLLPIIQGVGEAVDLPPVFQVVDADLEERPAKPTSLREAPGLPPELADEVTRSMDIVGDIAIIRLKDDIMSRAGEIGEALRSVHPRVRAVAVDDGVSGPLRLRALTLVAGEGPLVTTHREHGVTLRVDLEQAYFSPRLATEHRRVADLVRPGERVLDMFSGVGPFAVLIAKLASPREVHAVDLNPRAVELVVENAAANGVDQLVFAHEGDAREVVPPLRTFDRIVMNHPHGAYAFTDVALGASHEGTEMHLHLIGTEEEAREVLGEACSQAKDLGLPDLRLLGLHEVRTYAPGVCHFCLDLRLGD